MDLDIRCGDWSFETGHETGSDRGTALHYSALYISRLDWIRRLIGVVLSLSMGKLAVQTGEAGCET